MEEEVNVKEALELRPEEEAFLGKKTLFRFSLPYRLRFPLIWTAIFIVIGIVIQSIKLGEFVFLDFFWANYIQWFRDFGSFVDPTYYASIQDLIFSIMGKWYYFFYTGGLISLIWEILSLVIFTEIRLTGKPKERLVKERKLISVTKPVVEEATQEDKINGKLLEGHKLLLEGKIGDARKVYEDIQKIYDPKKDKNYEQYKKIIDFYNRLLKR